MKKFFKSGVFEWIKSFIVAVIIAYIFLTFVAFFAFVPTSSMSPTIEEGTRILVLKYQRYFDWEHRGLKYGDKVVFKTSLDGQPEKLYVKRLIGFGGDIISIDNGHVFRNGEELVEDYVVNKDSFFMEEITVPEGEIFVLGDNRANSYDSRYWVKKTVPIDRVVGEVGIIMPKLF